VRFQVLSEAAYQRVSRIRSLWFGIYYGIMLAMFLYNLILLISLRESNRLYYLLYLISIMLLFLEANGLLREFVQIGIHQDRVLVLIFISLTFFWGNLFAKSFLITKQNAPFFDNLLSAFMVCALVLAVMTPLMNLAWITVAVSLQSLVVPPIFLLAGLICWRRGFRPARFFLLAFALLALSAMYEALAIFDVLPYLTPYSQQFGSAIEVILLQMALTDRFRILSEDSGQFMTMFFLEIETKKMEARWVRGGHDPAIFYDPGTDSFTELGGTGIALGIDEDWKSEEYSKTDLIPGQLIFMSTDGIWEALNPQGDMFGKERILDIIRKNSSLSANQMIETMLGSLKRFQQGAQIEDDITLVMIKIV
jgi:hypothetical protein